MIGEEYKTEKTAFDKLTEEQNSARIKIKQYTDELETLLTEQKKAEGELTDLSIRLNVLENNISAQNKRSESIDSDIKKYENEIEPSDKEAGGVGRTDIRIQKKLRRNRRKG